VTVTTRVRANAALYELAPEPTRRAGRPPLKAKQLPSLDELANTLPFRQVTVIGKDGKPLTKQLAELRCLWYKPFYTQPIKLVLVRGAEATEEYEIAIASTDAAAAAAELVARYGRRWTIETAIQEGKANGVGQARNRLERAVKRTVPFGFLCQTLTIVWYQLHGDPERDIHARRLRAPWYPHKLTVSYTDMLAALRRALIRAEFLAQGHPRTNTPQIPPAQSPPASAAA